MGFARGGIAIGLGTPRAPPERASTAVRGET